MKGRELLPPASTSLEKVLADTVFPSDLDPETLLGSLWDADTCPLALLPYLAYALSVDVWNPKWPEYIKRAVIKASPEIHRRKGTVRAVRLSLESLGMAFDMTEWWETTPKAPHGTFKVVALVNDHYHGDLPLLNAEIQREAKQAITGAKPKSRTFSFSLGVQTQLSLGVKSGLSSVSVSIDPVALPRDIQAETVINTKSGFSGVALGLKSASAILKPRAVNTLTCASGLTSVNISIVGATI